MDPDRDADDVQDRIDRADLVKVDVLDADAMHVRLGLGQLGENFARGRLDGRVERTGGEHVRNRPETALRLPALFDLDVEPHGPDAVHHALGLLHRVSVEWQLGALGFESVQLQPQVEQRGDQHVAADAGKRVAIRNSHGFGSSSKFN